MMARAWLGPDILECEVKWACRSITTNKASGGDGIPVGLFQILKYDAIKVSYGTSQDFFFPLKYEIFTTKASLIQTKPLTLVNSAEKE